jgi:peptide/nickel transport system substrate-binding protein
MDVVGFDEVIGFHANPTVPLHLINEELWTGDWAKGPAGTSATAWDIGGLDLWDQKTGSIAESWDFPEPGTSIWHIRHGIHYWLNTKSEASRLVAGRELTADDVVFTLKMLTSNARAYLFNQPGLKNADITALDKWTVQCKVQPLYHMNAIMRFGDFASIVPPEVVQRYGDMSNWTTAQGTGPFMLTDYVTSSAVTLTKNPNYWDKDPVGPGKGNQLPYLNGVKMLIIPDASSMESAFRTGKIDQFGTDWETAPRLLAENPKLLYGTNIFDGGFNTHFYVGNPIFSDIRVRRAMMMAVDWGSLVNDLFGGKAEINVWPVTYNKAYEKVYLSLDATDCPDSVKELYKLDIDKAKALLTEAGYPNGFKTTVICATAASDYYSVIKDMWSKVNIDLTIDLREPAVHTGIWRSMNWTELCNSSMGGLGTAFVGGNIYGVGNSANGGRVNDKHVEEQVFKMIDIISKQGPAGIIEASGVHRELMKYVLDQAWVIPTPKAPGYRLWWPWVKNYRNEFAVGYWNEGNWSKWTWLDLNLKEQMIGHK